VTAPADCEPLWFDDEDDWDLAPVDPRLHDLRGQGRHGVQLTEERLRAITDITITGSYLITPDQEIRAAITKLRARLADPELTPGPWLSMDQGDRVLWGGEGAEDQPPVYVVDEPMSNGANADYIAAMDPNVGKALVGWLEVEEFRVLHNGRGPDLHHALAVARAINTGGQP
jgi:hypothetical protein